jgi:hypothetical protein
VPISDERDTAPASLIRLDGSRFDDELATIGASLALLDNSARESFRDRNADDIARQAAARILIVAGPGSGKSTLFLARIKYWLPLDRNARIYVSSFVRKLVKDLRSDIGSTADLSSDDQSRVTVTTLHHLALSLISRNRGTSRQPLESDVQVISAEWERMVWDDVLGFHADLTAQSYTHRRLSNQFHTEEFDESADWQAVVATYLRLGRFFNAVGFPDMIVLAREAVDENPDLREHSHWIIDEFQDFNNAEVHLLRSVTTTAAGVLIAGDDEQALYEQLKASLPEIIISYYDDPNFANAMLPYCSRCSYYICLAASAFIAKRRSPTAIPKIYLPLVEDSNAAKVRIVGTAAPTSAVDYIADFIDEHRSELDDYRAKMEVGEETDPYLLILTPAKDLSFFKSGGVAIRLRQLVAEWSTVQNRPSPDYWRTAAYASVGWSDSNNFALRKVLYYEGVSRTTVHVLLDAALTTDKRLIDVLDRSYDLLRTKATEVAVICGEQNRSPEEKAAALAGLLPIAEPDRLARDLQHHPLDLFRAVAGDEADEVIETAGAMAPVELLSLVGSKGLSAQHVIVIGCDDLHLQRVSRLTFFVALTRARESLHLITCLKAGGSKGPHSYLLELPGACCEYAIRTKQGVTLLPNAVAFVRKLARWSYGATQGRR